MYTYKFITKINAFIVELIHNGGTHMHRKYIRFQPRPLVKYIFYAENHKTIQILLVNMVKS